MIELAHGLIEGVGIAALCGGVWKLARLTTLVEDLRDNHLAHIRRTLEEQGKRIDRLYESRPK